jgi:hypothetical protein
MYDNSKAIKEKIKNYYKNKCKNKKLHKIYNEKIKISKLDQILNNIAKRTSGKFASDNASKENTHIELLGCNLEEFETYLVSKFKEGMTLDNYGEWEIDHIKPISIFNFNNKNEIFECCNYKNLQPLWKIDNIIKSNKYQSVESE